MHMHHHRPQRADTAGTLDDHALTLLLQRLNYAPRSPATDDDAASSWTLTQLLSALEEPTPLRVTRRTFAVTSKHALLQEVRATEALLLRQSVDRINNNGLHDEARHTCLNEPQQQQMRSGGPESDTPSICEIPTLHDLEALMSDLIDVYTRSYDPGDASDLSTSEHEYAHALEHAIVSALTHATLTGSATLNQRESRSSHRQQSMKHEYDALPLNDVRVWLLEMVVRPSALTRELAFALFLNLSVRVTAVALAHAARSCEPNDALSPQLQSWLFHVLVEMLSKSVGVASASSGSSNNSLRTRTRDPGRWIAHALDCVLLFVKRHGQYRADRLQALDPHTLQFFVRESSKSRRQSDDTDLLDSGDTTALTTRLLELLVVAMYAQESDVVYSDAASDHKRIAAFAFALPMVALESFGGLDLLLAHFYDSTTPLGTQELLFMVLFDVACHQQQQRKSPAVAAAEHTLWRRVHVAACATFIAASPSRFNATAIARLAKKLCTCASPTLTHALSEKHVQQLLTQLRLVVRC